MSDKYLKYQITTQKAGLRHQAYNLKTLIYESYILGRVAVISKWHLFGYHNFRKGVDTDFEKYFDFQGVRIEGKKPQIELEKNIGRIEVEQEYQMNDSIDPLAVMAVRKFPPNEGCSWKYLKTDFDIYHKVKIPYSKEVVTLAQKLRKEIDYPLTVVHVRRRDVLKKKWRLWKDTRPKNILNVLKKIGSPNIVYVMSNETKEGFFDEISRDYKLKLIQNIPWLSDIQKEDNFLAYCIENQLLKMADKKVTTFSDNTDEEWDGFLSKATW
tara:strand:- start:2353 stop:3159 length:807 start_codon:yes stop_codon:yes gene_type:complete